MHLVWYTRGLSLSAGILLVLVLWNQIDDRHSAEAYACLLSILAGTNLVAAANDLVSLFLALELVSIPTYVILVSAAARSDWRRSDAQVFSAQRVFVGARAVWDELAVRRRRARRTSRRFARCFRIARRTRARACWKSRLRCCWPGLCFRITAVPFHFYAPDVFQGTTAANAALLSFIPKIVGFVALLRLIPLTGATVELARIGCRSIRPGCCWPCWPWRRCSSAISWRCGRSTCIG